MAQADRDALIALYNATGGPNWTHHTKWDTGAPLGEWDGVTVKDSCVVELHLSHNMLRGPIPPELGNLRELQTLSLENNELTGPIPPELGKLGALQQLVLWGNKLSGPFPEALGALSKLERLSLHSNNLVGTIPLEVGNLKKLRKLWLYDNQLTGHIPKALGTLSMLQGLELSGNQLTGTIPEPLGALSKLEKLSLSSNQVTGPIPPELGNLEALEGLNLSKNQLSGCIPPQLGRLHALKSLALGGNKLTGSIPKELGALRELSMLDLSHNELAEIPLEVLELCRALPRKPDLAGNAWSRPPEAVLSYGLESALGWWNDVKQFGEGESNKLKLVLVGLANAGKTTIVRHFTGKPFKEVVERTVGIDITPDWRPLDAGPLQVSVWDFAGQADYYASHQLFLTEGALFLLVVDLHQFSKEMEGGVNNFTDPHGRVYWWLEMLHMRVPGAAVALVGSHVDQMNYWDTEQASADLHTVAKNFIEKKKASNASSRRIIPCMDAEPTTTVECDTAPDGVQHITPRDSFAAQRSSWSKSAAKPLVLHDHIFEVSWGASSVDELRQWIVRAASGRECPSEFSFPAVGQVVPKAWIEAYSAMDVLKEKAPHVLWSTAVEEFRKRMGGRLPDADDAGNVLWRAMKHREAEGGVLLSLADPSAPVATDMFYLDPSWLIELVRRLSDHNLVDDDTKKSGTVMQGLRDYAGKVEGITIMDLVEMYSVYRKSGRLNRGFLRYLWMHHKIVPAGPPIVLTNAEFESVVSTMKRLLVMYTANDADILVVPARLPECGDRGIVDGIVERMEGVVLTQECSFGQVYPPPGIIGRFLAWSARQVGDYAHCWQHGAFFSYMFQDTPYDAFLYEEPVEELHEDGSKCKHAGLVLGVGGPRHKARAVHRKLKESLRDLVKDRVHGYPGIAGLFYFMPDVKESESKSLSSFRSLGVAVSEMKEVVVDNAANLSEVKEVVVDNAANLGEVKEIVVDNAANLGEVKEVAVDNAANLGEVKEIVVDNAANLDEVKKVLAGFGGIVSLLLEQQLLAASDELCEYPHLVLVRPELVFKDSETPEHTQRAGWERWTESLSDIGSHKFRLHFLCEHDLSEVPCGPEGRGYLIKQPKKWVKQCLPLMQGSLWALRVAVGTMSNVNLPLNDLLGAFAKATSAELVNSVSEATENVGSAAVPVFGAEATDEEIRKYKRLRGMAYETLCDFMQDVESPIPCWSRCLSGHRTQAVVDWRENMVKVQNPRTGRWAWVLHGNKEEYVRKLGGAIPRTNAPSS